MWVLDFLYFLIILQIWATGVLWLPTYLNLASRGWLSSTLIATHCCTMKKLIWVTGKVDLTFSCYGLLISLVLPMMSALGLIDAFYTWHEVEYLWSDKLVGFQDLPLPAKASSTFHCQLAMKRNYFCLPNLSKALESRIPFHSCVGGRMCKCCGQFQLIACPHLLVVRPVNTFW